MRPPKVTSKMVTPPTIQPDQTQPHHHYHHHRHHRHDPYQNMAVTTAGLPEGYFKPDDPSHRYAALHDLTALPDSFIMPFEATSCGGGPEHHDDWTWAVTDIPTASLMPSLDTGSTISNVSTQSNETLTNATMMPPARPYPATRASSLDFSTQHPSLCPSLDVGHRLQSPAVLSELSDISTIRSPCPSPHRVRATGSTGPTAKGSSRNVCSWAGCLHLCFTSHEELVWHVKADHLLVCPAAGCVETTFASARHVCTHLAVAHPELGLVEVKEWVLDNKKLPPATEDDACDADDREQGRPPERRTESRPPEQSQMRPLRQPARVPAAARHLSVPVEDAMTKELLSVATSKRKCQEQLRNAVEKRAKKRANGNHFRQPSPGVLTTRLTETKSIVGLLRLPLLVLHVGGQPDRPRP